MRLQSDSGAETVMSTELSRSPDSAMFYHDLRDGRGNRGSCDFIDKTNNKCNQNSIFGSKLSSPTKFSFRCENGHHSNTKCMYIQ